MSFKKNVINGRGQTSFDFVKLVSARASVAFNFAFAFRFFFVFSFLVLPSKFYGIFWTSLCAFSSFLNNLICQSFRISKSNESIELVFDGRSVNQNSAESNLSSNPEEILESFAFNFFRANGRGGGRGQGRDPRDNDRLHRAWQEYFARQRAAALRRHLEQRAQEEAQRRAQEEAQRIAALEAERAAEDARALEQRMQQAAEDARNRELAGIRLAAAEINKNTTIPLYRQYQFESWRESGFRPEIGAPLSAVDLGEGWTPENTDIYRSLLSPELIQAYQQWLIDNPYPSSEELEAFARQRAQEKARQAKADEEGDDEESVASKIEEPWVEAQNLIDSFEFDPWAQDRQFAQWQRYNVSLEVGAPLPGPDRAIGLTQEEVDAFRATLPAELREEYRQWLIENPCPNPEAYGDSYDGPGYCTIYLSKYADGRYVSESDPRFAEASSSTVSGESSNANANSTPGASSLTISGESSNANANPTPGASSLTISGESSNANANLLPEPSEVSKPTASGDSENVGSAMLEAIGNTAFAVGSLVVGLGVGAVLTKMGITVDPNALIDPSLVGVFTNSMVNSDLLTSVAEVADLASSLPSSEVADAASSSLPSSDLGVPDLPALDDAAQDSASSAKRSNADLPALDDATEDSGSSAKRRKI